jgi:hypothetical protein
MSKAEALEVRQPAGRGGAPAGRSRRRADPVRITCHLVAELPLVVLCLRSLSTGWRATSDDAVVAWRAWDVLSAHPTLLGAPTHTTGLGHQAFAPGPALSWLLAVPVHVDPDHGALWGSTVIALAAAALTVEACWAAGGRWGALGGAATVLVLVTTETAVLMNLPWTPWQGALWLVAALAAAWATSTGRWNWWPACVVAASVAAQAHVVFALTAVSVCALSPVAAVVVDRRRSHPDPGSPEGRRSGRGARARPVVIGLVAGFVLWLPPLVDELWGRPGNLTLLWRSSDAAGGRIGYAHAFSGLGAASWPPFSWTHRLPTTGSNAFLSTFDTTFHGGPWRGAVSLLLLVVLGSWCVATRRTAVGALAWLAVVVGVTAVVTIAQTPASDAFELVYLGVLFWPVGMLVVGATAAGTIAVLRSALAGRVAGTTGRRLNAALLALGILGLIGISFGVTVVDGTSEPNSLSVQGGPAMGVLTDRAAAAVSAVVPPGPFELVLSGATSAEVASAVYPAIAYELVAKGLPVRLPFEFAVGADASRTSPGHLPVVDVDVGSGLPTARMESARR